jgi:undecaprenyl-diphosphatase
MIPVIFLGIFFKEEIEGFFTGNVMFVGFMLLITSVLLMSTYLVKENEREISFFNSFIIGIAQALAVLPGISRSGATISTGLLLGNKKANIARFSFLMVLIPIIGANFKDIYDGSMNSDNGIGFLPLIVGFAAAFISGLLACKWMIGIVKKGKLIYFAIYCFLIGTIAIVYTLVF